MSSRKPAEAAFDEAKVESPCFKVLMSPHSPSSRCPSLLSIGPDPCLQSLTTVMPRGRKSKHCAHEKRHQDRAETQGLHDHDTTSGEEETTFSSPPDSESTPSSSSAAGTLKGRQGAQGTTSAAAGAIRKRSGGGGTARSRSGVGGTARSRSGVGAEGQVQGGENSSQASAAAESSHTDLLTREAESLLWYMLFKYMMRELIKRSEMLKVIHRSYREQFPEILSRDSECMELEFGLVLKEVRPNSHCYTLVSNLDLSDSESMRGDWGLPKNGLLMPLLSFIYLNGPRISEEHIWKFLNILGIYDGRRHFIFGDTRKLITEDLVREEYLEYRQVPGSNPPRYEFLWGPKALTENSKTKVLQFLTKVNDLVPDALLPHHEEALREEAERTGARAATGTGPSASASADPSASARPGTSAAARAGTSASAMADMSALAGAGPLASARDGTSAAARDGTSAAARDGTSASTSAHSRATSSRSSGP